MGCCSGDSANPEDRKRNEEIDKQLKADRARLGDEVKLLLLGAGESGKSTILKQMRLIHDQGYTKEDKDAYKEIIFSNTIQSMRVILEAMGRLEIEYAKGEESEKHAQVVLEQPGQIEEPVFPPRVAAAIKGLWSDAGIRSCVERSNEFQLNDSAK